VEQSGRCALALRSALVGLASTHVLTGERATGDLANQHVTVVVGGILDRLSGTRVPVGKAKQHGNGLVAQLWARSAISTSTTCGTTSAAQSSSVPQVTQARECSAVWRTSSTGSCSACAKTDVESPLE
jgi:hypothetical protein